jgi:hypothetical protein
MKTGLLYKNQIKKLQISIKNQLNIETLKDKTKKKINFKRINLTLESFLNILGYLYGK